MTVTGGSDGATRKPKQSTATPKPPISPNATPPRRIPIKIAHKTSANCIQNISIAFPLSHEIICCIAAFFIHYATGECQLTGKINPWAHTEPRPSANIVVNARNPPFPDDEKTGHTPFGRAPGTLPEDQRVVATPASIHDVVDDQSDKT